MNLAPVVEQRIVASTGFSTNVKNMSRLVKFAWSTFLNAAFTRKLIQSYPLTSKIRRSSQSLPEEAG
jgi:hypothetical protein